MPETLENDSPTSRSWGELTCRRVTVGVTLSHSLQCGRQACPPRAHVLWPILDSMGFSLRGLGLSVQPSRRLSGPRGADTRAVRDRRHLPRRHARCPCARRPSRRSSERPRRRQILPPARLPLRDLLAADHRDRDRPWAGARRPIRSGLRGGDHPVDAHGESVRRKACRTERSCGSKTRHANVWLQGVTALLGRLGIEADEVSIRNSSGPRLRG